MIAGLIPPTGSLGALSPYQVLVSPIAAVAVAVGDVVQFDLSSSASATGYVAAANLANYDENTCPFNVVIKSVAQTDGGVFGVVTTAAAAGNRCVVCVAGVVNAFCTGTFTIGTGATQITATAGTGVLVPSATGAGAVVAIPLAANSGGPFLVSVLFDGFALGSNAA